jgi:hypothetical protein
MLNRGAQEAAKADSRSRLLRGLMYVVADCPSVGQHLPREHEDILPESVDNLAYCCR